MEKIVAASPPYREGTEIAPTKVTLVYNAGGIGDYIHWTSAIRYVIDSNPHLHGRVLAPKYFFDLAELWLGKYNSRFTVETFDVLETHPAFTDSAVILPNNKQLVNACGFHLTELGFYYFTQKKFIPENYREIPRIEGSETPICQFALPKDYVVIPSEATSDTRRMSAELFNSVTKYLIGRVTPVILGKHVIAPDHTAVAADGISTEGVIDLREKTSLREAACIMARAKFTLGMDGGLLHLASCGPAPVIFIFTTVHPHFRIPKRRPGARTVIVTPPRLPCRFCNTGNPEGPSMSYVIGHDFKNCLYKDNLCTKIIGAETIIPIMDKLLNGE